MDDTTTLDESVTVNKLIRDFKVVMQDAEMLIKATAGDIGDKLGERAKEARSRLISSLDSAKTSCHTLEDRAVAGARATDKVIRDYPYQSLGVAFAVGLFIGVLVARG
jgi:ElaB/YqjD/DUF883 family membrane-anchored ribosome-binding protein